MSLNFQSPVQEELSASNNQAAGFKSRAEDAEALVERLTSRVGQLQDSEEGAAQVSCSSMR